MEDEVDMPGKISKHTTYQHYDYNDEPRYRKPRREPPRIDEEGSLGVQGTTGYRKVRVARSVHCNGRPKEQARD